VRAFAEKCVAGLEADAERCRELVDRSLMLVTALNPHIGYEAAAAIAKEAFATGRTLREIVLEKKLLDAATLDKVLDPLAMTRPGEDPGGTGARVLAGESPSAACLVVSGRAGFELVQKAVAAGVGALVAVGAPSALAVHLAGQAGLRLHGFTRSDRSVRYT